MHIIAHRGLTLGPNTAIENSPDTIRTALAQFYLVEVDVRMKDGKAYLGHDEPQYEMPEDFIHSPDIIFHAKDRLSLHFLQQRGVHHFWHGTDDYTLTSQGWVWAYPGQQAAGRECIAVMPESSNTTPESLKNTRFTGVCTDYAKSYHDVLNF